MKYSHLAQKLPQPQRSWWRNERGVGVVELGVLAVLIISAVAVVGPKIKDTIERSRFNGCVVTALAIESALKQGGDQSTVLNSDNAKKLLECRTTIEEIMKNNARVASDERSKATLDKIQTLIGQFDKCVVTLVNPLTSPAGASDPKSVEIRATIPIEKPQGQNAQDVRVGLTASTGETGELTRDNDTFNFSGSIGLDGSKLTKETEVTLTLAPPSGAIVAGCPSATFTWTAPIKPNIVHFTVPPTVKPNTPFAIAWEVKDADVGGVSVTGVGEGLNSIGFPSVTITKDTTFTLTAKRGNQVASSGPKTVTVEQTEPPSPVTYAVTLSTVGLATRVIDEFVSVTGTVTPVPPAGTLVAIGVNGTPVANVSVEGNTFSSQVRLTHRTSASDLSLSSDGRHVTTCGNTSSPITLRNNNSSSGAGNVINAAVLAAGGGTASNIASLVVYHGVRVTSGVVSWSGCPAPNQSLSGGSDVIGFNEERTIGDVHCGTTCPGSGTLCTGTASISVDTTVGRVFTQSTWVVDIP